ncbi:TonB-dependent siderophore receptor [Dysgonomonas sp. ZJ709]|uniref:TonB-dependent receptor n=1 Tax=Dysgonomonas sp. ZJ709 TaxID=2709797 RepID=UPI0013EC160C|nr:TonB-dependent siderophore receptor [Dysgonomonas sp. ZJ709]
MKKIILSAIFIMAAGVINAQYKNITDTVHAIKEIVIEAPIQQRVNMINLNVPLSYLPLSVTSVSSKDLEMRGILNLEDAVKFLPGTRMQTSYGAFQTFSVRGFTNAAIMIDGVRDERTIVNSNPFPDLSSVESLELLKGPASVLYGHSVVGGVLNITRKAPTATTTVNTRMSYGSWQNRQVTMDFGGKLVDKLNYRATINYADQEGWRDNGNNRLSGYLALGYKLDATSNIVVRGGAVRDFYGTEIGLPPNMANDIYNLDGTSYLKKGEMQPGLNRKARYNNESDFFYNKNFNISARYDKVFGNGLKLENYISYISDDIDYFGTEELSYLESGEDNPIYNHYYKRKSKDGLRDSTVYISLDTVQLTFPLRFSHLSKTLMNQFELSGKLETGDIKHNFLGGYNFSQMNRNSFTGYNLGKDVQGPGLFSKVVVNDPQSMGYMTSSFSKVTLTKFYTHGIYLQDLIELNDKWKVMLAGRYDFFKYMSESGIPTYNGKRQYHKSEQKGYFKNNTSAFSYRLGTVYLPHPDVSVYASMASFFTPYSDVYSEKTVYINGNGDRFYPEEGKEIFKPQTGYQAEIGTRYTYKSLLQATGSVYYIRRNNEKKTLDTVEEDGVTKNVIGQVGSTESKGFDLDISIYPTSGLALTLGYAYIDAKIVNLAKNKYLDVDPNKGMTLATIPKNTFIAAGNYTVQKGFFKNLGVNFTVSYMDEVYRSLSNDIYFPSYWLTDMGASYKLNSGIRLSVNVNNMFNEKYYNQALGNQMVPSAPTNFLATISYSLK